MKWIALAIIAAGACLLFKQAGASQREPGDPPAETDTQETTLFEELQVQAESIMTEPAPPSDDATRQTNRSAFLDMLAYSEGTSGPNGYKTMFGGRTFESFADHPRVFAPFTDKTGKQNVTSAAGRYQFLAKTWDSLRDKLQLPDFGPESQDAAALELVRQRGALEDVDAGLLESAVRKCAPIWASLPGAGYNQPERKFAQLKGAYIGAGGTVAA